MSYNEGKWKQREGKWGSYCLHEALLKAATRQQGGIILGVAELETLQHDMPVKRVGLEWVP